MQAFRYLFSHALFWILDMLGRYDTWRRHLVHRVFGPKKPKGYEPRYNGECHFRCEEGE